MLALLFTVTVLRYCEAGYCRNNYKYSHGPALDYFQLSRGVRSEEVILEGCWRIQHFQLSRGVGSEEVILEGCWRIQKTQAW